MLNVVPEDSVNESIIKAKLDHERGHRLACAMRALKYLTHATSSVASSRLTHPSSLVQVLGSGQVEEVHGDHPVARVETSGASCTLTRCHRSLRLSRAKLDLHQARVPSWQNCSARLQIRLHLRLRLVTIQMGWVIRWAQTQGQRMHERRRNRSEAHRWAFKDSIQATIEAMWDHLLVVSARLTMTKSRRSSLFPDLTALRVSRSTPVKGLLLVFSIALVVSFKEVELVLIVRQTQPLARTKLLLPQVEMQMLLENLGKILMLKQWTVSGRALQHSEPMMAIQFPWSISVCPVITRLPTEVRWLDPLDYTMFRSGAFRCQRHSS